MGVWLRRLSVIALLGFPFAVLVKRLGVVDFSIAFNIVTATVALSLLVLLIGLIVMIWQRKSNPTSAKAAAIACLLSLIPLIGIGSQLLSAKSVPAIHNISTDTQDPPQFNKIVSVRGVDSNPLEYDADVLAEIQQAAYPTIKTVVLPISQQQAYQSALAVAEELDWDVIAADAGTGMIEATETTALWSFKDDIVIRVRQNSNQVEIDLRSVSRVGVSDLGANAKRIQRFIELFRQQNQR